jgi:hypothetical protein
LLNSLNRLSGSARAGTVGDGRRPGKNAAHGLEQLKQNWLQCERRRRQESGGFHGKDRHEHEYRSHFSLWAIMAALGTQGKRVRHENDQDVWVKPLQNGAIAMVMLNRGAAGQTITLKPQRH